MSMPPGLKHLHCPMGGLSDRIWPSEIGHPPSSSNKIKSSYSRLSWKLFVLRLLSDLSEPLVLVYPDWDAATESSRRCSFRCCANVESVRATLEKKKKDGFLRVIVYPVHHSRAILNFGLPWNPLDLEAGNLVWSTKRLRKCLWNAAFRILLSTTRRWKCSKGLLRTIRPRVN